MVFAEAIHPIIKRQINREILNFTHVGTHKDKRLKGSQAIEAYKSSWAKEKGGEVWGFKGEEGNSKKMRRAVFAFMQVSLSDKRVISGSSSLPGTGSFSKIF